MRRLALYLLISILTFLIGSAAALVFDGADASKVKTAYSNAKLKSADLFHTIFQPRRFVFDDLYTSGGSVIVKDEKTGRIYCLSESGRIMLSD